MTDLIPIESINAVEVFTGGKLDELLAIIRQETTTVVPDIETPAGRKDIASLAYKVARSKTTIDDAGKELVAEWKQQSAAVDAARKKARDYLDALKDEVRKPLTDWEAEQARIEREKIEEAARVAAEAEAARIAEIERREAEIRAREEAIAEAERIANAAAEAKRLDDERIAREEQNRIEAEAKAQREAAEAIANAERDRQAAEAAQAAAEARAVAEAEAAAERAKQAAIDAERAQAEAVRQAELRAKQEAERIERERVEADRAQKAADDKRAADVAHRKEVNNAALAALVKEGIDEEAAKKCIIAIASGLVPNVVVRY